MRNQRFFKILSIVFMAAVGIGALNVSEPECALVAGKEDVIVVRSCTDLKEQLKDFQILYPTETLTVSPIDQD